MVMGDDELKDRVFSDGDREVWVVEWAPRAENPHWRTGAVLTSHADAEAYRDDLREALNTYPDEFPYEYKKESDVRIRHGGRKSPTKMFESYPPANE
jgi:hypothetical protein